MCPGSKAAVFGAFVAGMFFLTAITGFMKSEEVDYRRYNRELLLLQKELEVRNQNEKEGL